ncbi:substance-P receptor-like [Stylophora pistillata]|uniref:substance-P receptor-like n=1 Tax=Stylophora pistillata TaxID=50429 RepID=UPI000C045A2A|nr:substance-P receptor-like [Stylophora pistillata]
MKSTTNFLILNQSCSDLLATFSRIIYIAVLQDTSLRKLWFGGIPGLVTCKLFLTCLFVPRNFSVLILVAIAFDRFFAVTQPFRQSPLSKHLKKTIVFLWLWCIIASSYMLAKGSVQNIQDSFYCDYNENPDQVFNEWKEFNVTAVVIFCLLPVLVVVVLYTIVCYKLWSRKVPGEQTNQNQGSAEALKTAKKVTRMMVVVAALFVLCWFPYYLTLLVQFSSHGPRNYKSELSLIWLTVAFSGFNPYIYLTFNQAFRTGFHHLFGKNSRKIKIPKVMFFRSQSVELEQM